MKNQYFGDVNDYLKYGILRSLASAGFDVGVVWMLTPDDGRPDGQKLRYLSSPARWRNCDPELFDVLREAVVIRPREAALAEAFRIIPRAYYFSEVVPTLQAERSAWFERGMLALTEADLLFFDPDNGLEVTSTPRGRGGSGKYLYWDEVERAWAHDKSLLIFQHFAREQRVGHVARLAHQLEEHAAGASVAPLRTANVFFLLALRPEHESRGRAALALIAANWAGTVLVTSS